LIKTEEQLEKVLYSLKCSVRLHQNMIDQAVENGEKVFGKFGTLSEWLQKTG